MRGAGRDALAGCALGREDMMKVTRLLTLDFASLNHDEDLLALLQTKQHGTNRDAGKLDSAVLACSSKSLAVEYTAVPLSVPATQRTVVLY